MATRSSATRCGPLPEAVPLALEHTTRLSWELGSRVVGDETAVLDSRWRRTEAGWGLSVYRVTNHTDILEVRTPVGREQFYGVTRSEFESAVSALDASDRWQRAD